jgi:hypothetical protein
VKDSGGRPLNGLGFIALGRLSNPLYPLKTKKKKKQ